MKSALSQLLPRDALHIFADPGSYLHHQGLRVHVFDCLQVQFGIKILALTLAAFYLFLEFFCLFLFCFIKSTLVLVAAFHLS